MIKKFLCLILVVMFVFSSVPLGSEAMASDTMSKLNALVNRFPQGKYWNHVGKSNQPDGVTTTPCGNHSNCHWAANSCNCNSFDNAIQCMGYAHKISYEITGVMPRNNYIKHTTLKASELRVGDIIRYRWNGHSICVTGVSGNKISFTDCNYIGRCQIRWGIMNLSEIVGFSYVLRLKGNTRKNSDLDFYENVDGYISGVDIKANFETWRTNDNVVNIRSTRKTSANIIGKLPANTDINIYDKYYDGVYLWGKVVYGELMGWCALNYSSYIEGYIEKPTIQNTNEAYVAEENFTINWNGVSGATEYTLYIYDSNKNIVKEFTVNSDKTEKSFKINKAGQYDAEVVATSVATPSWQIKSSKYSFDIVKADDVVNVESVKFTAPGKITKGSSVTIEPEVYPSWATDCAVTWKSSDTSVLTVSKKGKITAKKYGTATITCTAADQGKVKYKQTITVVPEAVSDLKQTAATTTSVTLKWSKVADAKFYAVYMYNTETKSYDKIDTCKENTYTMKASAGKTYTVKVHAVAKADSKNYYSVASDIIKVVSSPKAPTLKATAGYKKITLNWSESKGATHYVIYSVENGENVKVATLAADNCDFEYIVSSLKSGNYAFRIRAIRKADNIKGYGSYSGTVTVKVK